MSLRHVLASVCVVSMVITLVCCHGEHGHDKHPSMKDPDSGEDIKNPIADADFVRNIEHAKQHLEFSNFDPATATAEELDFFFFQQHDTDDDQRLDGLEMYASVAHTSDHNFARIETHPDWTPSQKSEKYVQLQKKFRVAVDTMLFYDDQDGDGYLTWREYRMARDCYTDDIMKKQSIESLLGGFFD